MGRYIFGPVHREVHVVKKRGKMHTEHTAAQPV